MKVLQTSALATWLRRLEKERCKIAGMRFSANAAQAIKYEKRRGKSSAKRNGMSTAARVCDSQPGVLAWMVVLPADSKPIAYDMGG
jgi:hypothetical protein